MWAWQDEPCHLYSSPRKLELGSWETKAIFSRDKNQKMTGRGAVTSSHVQGGVMRRQNHECKQRKLVKRGIEVPWEADELFPTPTLNLKLPSISPEAELYPALGFSWDTCFLTTNLPFLEPAWVGLCFLSIKADEHLLSFLLFFFYNCQKMINVGEDVEKLELWYIVDGNAKWRTCYAKQYGDSSK